MKYELISDLSDFVIAIVCRVSGLEHLKKCEDNSVTKVELSYQRYV